MYIPDAFREDDPAVMHTAIRSCGLAILVTVTADGPIATHLPLLLAADEGEFGTLHGHVARANTQWKDALPGVQALAIFAGPDGYVSPSWYPAKQAHGRVVPTWNYITVHAIGTAAFHDDAGRLRDLVSRLTDHHEAGRAAPWAANDAPPDFMAAQLRGIVGVSLPIDRLEGKWKLSQNRPAADRAGVVAGLGAEPEAGPLGAAMRALQQP